MIHILNIMSFELKLKVLEITLRNNCVESPNKISDLISHIPYEL